MLAVTSRFVIKLRIYYYFRVERMWIITNAAVKSRTFQNNREKYDYPYRTIRFKSLSSL
jgi:hypothetical protein